MSTNPSTQPLTLEMIDLLTVDASTFGQLRTELLEVQNDAMVGAHEGDLAAESEAYTEALFDPSVDWSYCTVALSRHEGQAVAFVLGRVRPYTHQGRDIDLFYMTTFTRHAWTGRDLTTTGFRRVALDFGIRRALFARRPGIYVGLCMSPFTYGFTHRRTRGLMPSPDYEPSPWMRSLYQDLFGHRLNADGLVVEPRAGRLDDRQRARLARTASPAVRWFLQRNPHFDQGYGLPLLVPCTGWNFARSVGLTAALQAKRALGRRRARR